MKPSKIIQLLELTKKIMETIPYEGFDEWFFLEKNEVIKVEEVFVNYTSFSLKEEKASETFWNLIHDIEPFAYVSDGFRLTVVSKRKEIFECLQVLPLT